MILANDYVKFLVENGITQRQLLFLHLSYFKEQKLLDLYKKRFKIFEDIPHSKQAFLSMSEFSDLEEKGFIRKDNNSYVITDKFIIAYGVKDTIIRELVAEYPNFIFVGNKQYPACIIDYSVMSELYYKYIYGSLAQHRRILNLIKVAKPRNLLNMKLETFIKSKYWTVLEDNEDDTKVVQQNSTIKSVNISDDE